MASAKVTVGADMFLQAGAAILLLTSMTQVGSRAVAPAAQEGTADEGAVKRLGTVWQESWNRRDAAGLASIMDEDVVFVSVLGPDTPGQGRGGRAAFQAAHAAMLKAPPFADSMWTTREVKVVRRLGSDVMVAHVLWETTGDKVRHVKWGSPRRGIFTWVLNKQPDGRWLVSASQNTEVMPPLAGQE
jgi:uncharacterized protein (TIGR02246 family)